VLSISVASHLTYFENLFIICVTQIAERADVKWIDYYANIYYCVTCLFTQTINSRPSINQLQQVTDLL
jgi:hypothetical protein